MIFFTIIGVLVVSLITVWVVAEYCEVGPINGVSGPDGYICKILGFGVIYSKHETVLNENLNQLRKTKNQQWFFTAPSWFNRCIYNVGGVK